MYQNTICLDCGYCGKRPSPETKFHQCARCKVVSYCSKACQKRHWKLGHKDICRAPPLNPPEDPTPKIKNQEEDEPVKTNNQNKKKKKKSRPKPSSQGNRASASQGPGEAEEDTPGCHRFAVGQRVVALYVEFEHKAAEGQGREEGWLPGIVRDVDVYDEQGNFLVYVIALDNGGLYHINEDSNSFVRHPDDADLENINRAATSSSSFGEHENCTICLDTLVNPIKLPCGHWFCKGCINRLRRSTSVQDTCPTCREPLPPGDDKIVEEINYRVLIFERKMTRLGHGMDNLPSEYQRELANYCRHFEELLRRGNLTSHSLQETHFVVGVVAKEGRTGPQDLAKALKHFNAGAQAGGASSQQQLGSMFDFGFGVPQSFTKAKMWYDRAAAQGNDQAYVSLGFMFLNGRGVAKDPRKAFKYYELAAETGNVFALNNLAMFHAQGECVPRDLNRAVQYWERAAVLGHETAQYNLAGKYREGMMVPQDMDRARLYYEKAAVKGIKEAMYALGEMYHLGEGGPKDFAQARKWWEAAATQGNMNAHDLARVDRIDTHAHYKLGQLELQGLGCPRSSRNATIHWEQAAKLGDARTQLNLGYMYGSGHGDLDPDTAKARAFLELAAAQQDQQVASAAQGALAGLKNGMPHTFLPWKEGDEVEASGLVNRPDLNGVRGRLLRHIPGEDPATDRWEVQLEDGHGTVRLKDRNIKGR